MNYWWVNHKQTYKSELGGGYIWSPFVNIAGRPNQGYLNLSLVRLGDIIFSHAKGRILAIGIVLQKEVKAKKPPEFGKAGDRWPDEGRFVEVRWTDLSHALLPKAHLNSIVPHLPPKHSPIKSDGNGNEIYLSSISQSLGELLLRLTSIENPEIFDLLSDVKSEIQEKEELDSLKIKPIPITKREAIIKARVGQGIFRTRVEKVESKCRVTGVSDKEFLIASHIKSWKDSTDQEKLDGHNGLLLSPHVDKLFDKGYIAFTDHGEIILAHVKIGDLMTTWKLDKKRNVGVFSKRQRVYLQYHRDITFENKKKQLAEVSTQIIGTL